jgi:hypothetical protein
MMSWTIIMSMTCYRCAINHNNFLFHILLFTSLHVSTSTGHPQVKIYTVVFNGSVFSLNYVM